MPRRDGSGPMGAGALTGRGLGNCTGAKLAKYGVGLGTGLGLGLACRRGFGRGRRFYEVFETKQDSDNLEKVDKDLLKEQKELLQSKIDAIDKKLEDL